MKQVRNTLGRLVQSLARKPHHVAPAQPAKPLQELDARAVAQVGGGLADVAGTPNKGW